MASIKSKVFKMETGDKITIYTCGTKELEGVLVKLKYVLEIDELGVLKITKENRNYG